MSETYAFNDIEARWQREWDQRQSFRAAQPGEPGGDRPKYYVLDFFPYPSGAGLHVGHPLGYIASDIIARFMRMRGHNVLHPMGWDAFGLPAEQYAVETGVHPAITTRKNIETYTRQLKLVGLSYDWSREISTCEPDYYHWTQWIFLQIYNAWYDPEFRWTDGAGRAVKGKARHIRELPIPEDVRARGDAAIEEFQADHRLAFLAEIPVNWCPALGTVLANEEVTADGRSERGNHPVFRRPMKQWILRITEYADRLLSDLDPLDWPEPIKLMQRNWIGRSEGAYVDFRLTNADGKPSENVIRVFTTRPDTLYGATYLVLAPEHHLVEMITTPEHREPVHAYVQLAKQKSDLDRTADAKGKSGVFTGAYAINPVTGGRVPVWVADYVLAGYGTGSIMAVPAHDTRDFDFAKTHQLPIRDVIYPHAIAAMKYFSEHAAPAERADHVWIERLADFLGLVGAQDATAEQYAAALSTVRERRQADRTPSHAGESDIAGVLGHDHVQRGVIKMTWVEALENLNFANFEDFRKPFLSGGFYARRGSAYTEEGTCVNCKSAWADFDWMRSPEMKKAIVAKLAADGLGEATIQYKLRDWLFSRQRYWGEPFPILYREDGRITAEQEENLPVTLPQMEDFKPTASDDPNAEPQTPLSRAKEWVTVRRDGQTLRRELNTMPQWAGSCWYYIRFCDPKNSDAFIQRHNEKYWLGDTKAESGAQAIGGVDLYMGGAEHAVLHLLYARFWHKMLYDLGHVSTPEPFQKLFNQGMIGADSYRDERGVYAPADQIVEGPEAEMSHPEQIDPRRFAELMRSGLNEIEAERGARVRVKTTYFHDGRPVFKTFDKMSKTKKNVVNPDDIIREYGADTLRLYEMYMGPLEASKPWNTRDIIGVHRFLQRVWRLVIEGVAGARDENASATARGRDDGAPWRINSKIGAERNDAIERLLHKTIKKIGHDIPKFMFNTSIAQMIVFVNEAQKAESIGRDQVERFLHVLSPFAPHIAEELWSRLGHTEPLAGAAWPTFDDALTRDDTIEIAVQVNGKVRGRVSIAADADDAGMIAAACELENVQREIASRTVKRSICVKGRLVNLIVG